MSSDVDAGRRAFLSGGFLTDRAGATAPASGSSGRSGVASLDRDACVAWDGVVCISCRSACVDGAIVMDGRRRPHVQAASCTGCASCFDVCPTAAIAASEPAS